MHNVEFSEQNHIIIPKGTNNLRPMNCWTDGHCCISVWELTDEEIKLLAETRKLYMIVGTPPVNHPLIGLSAEDIVPKPNQLNLILPNG